MAKATKKDLPPNIRVGGKFINTGTVNIETQDIKETILKEFDEENKDLLRFLEVHYEAMKYFKVRDFLSESIDLIRKEEREICICSAIKITESTIIRGQRHSDCIHTAVRRGWTSKAIGQAEQGFITSQNRFVSREEARALQESAGIKSKNPDGYQGDTLYSEDLY